MTVPPKYLRPLSDVDISERGLRQLEIWLRQRSELEWEDVGTAATSIPVGPPATSLEGAYLTIGGLEAWWRLGESGTWPNAVTTADVALDSSGNGHHLAALNRNNAGTDVALAPAAAGMPEMDVAGALTLGDPAINDGGIRFNLNIYQWLSWGAKVAYFTNAIYIDEQTWCAGLGAGASVTCWVKFLPTTWPGIVNSFAPYASDGKDIGFRPLFGDYYSVFGSTKSGIRVGFDPFYGYLKCIATNYVTIASTYTFATSFQCIPDQWYFLAMTVTLDSPGVYTRRVLLNSTEVASITGNAATVGLAAGNALYLGGAWDDDIRFGQGAGCLDEVALFSRALTDEEIYHQYTVKVEHEGDTWTTGS